RHLTYRTPSRPRPPPRAVTTRHGHVSIPYLIMRTPTTCAYACQSYKGKYTCDVRHTADVTYVTVLVALWPYDRNIGTTQREHTMSRYRMVTVKGSNVRVGDYR